MKEIIDVDSDRKLMALIICGFKFGDSIYVMYAVKRDESDDNVFISKLVNSSSGYVMDNNFAVGEKEVIEEVVRDILNKEHIKVLNDNKVFIMSEVNVSGINKFSVSECYVTTVRRSLIKDVMVNYGLLDMDDDPVVVSLGKASTFNKGSISSLFLIFLGIGILIFCGFMLMQILGK